MQSHHSASNYLQQTANLKFSRQICVRFDRKRRLVQPSPSHFHNFVPAFEWLIRQMANAPIKRDLRPPACTMKGYLSVAVHFYRSTEERNFREPAAPGYIGSEAAELGYHTPSQSWIEQQRRLCPRHTATFNGIGLKTLSRAELAGLQLQILLSIISLVRLNWMMRVCRVL